MRIQRLIRSARAKAQALGIARSVLGACAVSALIAGCAGAQLGASDETLAAARTAHTEGAELFATHCASCHGEKGEGTERGPSVIGLGALPVYPSDHDRATNSAFSDPQTLEEESRARPAGAPSRNPFRTAADVHAYVSKEMPMPKNAQGSLAADEYWSITSFMLAAHGAAVPQGGLNASNAASVRISGR